MRPILVTLLFFIFSISLFGIDLGLKRGVAYLSAGEVYFCDLDHRDSLQLTHTHHHVSAFALSPDKKFLAYSRIFKVVDEPGIWDSIVPQIPVCSIVMMDLEEQKIINELFPEEYEWLGIDHWINAGELLCELSSGFSVDDWYLFDTAGRVDTIGSEGRENVLRLYDNMAPGAHSPLRVIRDSVLSIHLTDDSQKTDSVIFKESTNINFKAISPDFQSVVWAKTSYGYYIVNGVMYSDYYHLYLKDRATNVSKLIMDEKNSRYRRNDNICFSPDNHVISIDWSGGDHIDLYFISKNQLMTIEGKLVDWIDAHRLLLVRENHLYVYDTQNDNSVLLINDVSKPQYIP